MSDTREHSTSRWGGPEQPCCETESPADVRQSESCPLCGKAGWRVRQVTLGNHVKEPHWGLVWEDGFHFCPTPDCDAVYFNNRIARYLTKADVKTRVGIKETEDPVPVCYCMNVDEKKILEEIVVKGCCDSLEDIKAYTAARTGKLCHVTNPGGRCCGEHVGTVVEKALAQVGGGVLVGRARELGRGIPVA